MKKLINQKKINLILVILKKEEIIMFQKKKIGETEINPEEDKGNEIDEKKREIDREKNLIKLSENKQNSYIRDF